MRQNEKKKCHEFGNKFVKKKRGKGSYYEM